MTNGNRFAIYLSSFHLVDLWCKGGDRGWILEGQSEDLELFDWGGEQLSAQCFVLSICLRGELTKTRYLTFLAEGDRQAGERVVLHSISVQLWGT